MKFSKAWLDEFLKEKVEIKQLVSYLTSIGLEVSSVEAVAPKFTKVVVAEIIDVKPHPDAEKLKICLVNVGQSHPITIVTNVATVRQNMKVPAALIGAVLPDGTKISRTKLRGVESEGMFCGAETLGIGEAAAGLVTLPAKAPVGTDIREYLQLDDQIIDIELTPNRGDCLSLLGVAREAALIEGCSLKPFKINEPGSEIKDKVSIKISAPKACPRYLGRVLRNVRSDARTPIWMAERLRRSGLASIHPVVDVTNYVMLELGQPLHAFDLAKIDQGIDVRFAKAGETLELLNHQTVKLTEDILVIADHKKALAMAGIMGGTSSAVSSETEAVFLEIAFFNPITVMGKARRYGFHTEGCHRFERGVDPALPMLAMRRATELLVEITDACPGPIVEEISAANLPQKQPILLRAERIKNLLGFEIDAKKIEFIFNGLGFSFEKISEGYKVLPPSCRFDMNIEANLIGELARIYGYDDIVAQHPKANLEIQAEQPITCFADTLKSLNYHEVITYSFVDPKIEALLAPDLKGLALSNPISPELAQMRTTLWSGLLRTAQYNLNRQQQRLRLFETGLRFIPSAKKLTQVRSLAGLALGPRLAEQWGAKTESIDFYDLKADVEVLLELTGADFHFEQTAMSLHPGRSAKIMQGKTELGLCGALHPRIQMALDLPPVYLFELNLELLEQLVSPRHFVSFSKFPAIRRDIAIIVDQDTTVAELSETIRTTAGNLLNDLIIFDVYQGAGIPKGRKSVAFGLFWQAMDQTLADSDVNTLMEKVLEKLKNSYRVQLRE